VVAVGRWGRGLGAWPPLSHDDDRGHGGAHHNRVGGGGAIDDGITAQEFCTPMNAVDEARINTAPLGVGGVGSSCE
jgi:hypothetical protein